MRFWSALSWLRLADGTDSGDAVQYYYQAALVLSAIVFSTAGVLMGLLITGQRSAL